MGRMRNLARNGRVAVVVVIALAAAFSFASGTHLIGERTAQIISNHLMTLLPLTAGVVSVFVARKNRGRARVGWSLLAAWGFLSATGNAIWEYYEFVLRQEVPFPSLADAGYLCGNLLAIAAVATLSEASERASRVRTLLDAVLVSGSVFILSWALVLSELYHGSEGGFVAEFIGLAYPVIDIAIVSLIVFVASRSEIRERRTMMIIGLGFLGWAVADSSFAYLTLKGIYHSGHPVDAGWMGGDALIALAALVALRAEPTSHVVEAVPAKPRRAYLPYIVGGTALAIGVASQFVRETIDAVVITGLMVLLLVVVARQFVMIVENQSLTIARLNAIDDMKNGILNAVSHELRTPLTFIKGTAELLYENDDLPVQAQRELLGGLARSSDRLEELLTGLLDLGRLTRGILEPERRSTDVTDLMGRVAAEVQTDDHPIRVDPSTVVANVDPTKLERIVENLFVNAVRHTPAGTKVSGRVTQSEEGVLISVEDDGPGVPEDLREMIFEPFVQSDKPVHFVRGTGIGLSLVAKFAELHGGRAWVEESATGGALFCVLLPEGEPLAAAGA